MLKEAAAPLVIRYSAYALSAQTTARQAVNYYWHFISPSFRSSVKTYLPFPSSHTKRFPDASISSRARKTRLAKTGAGMGNAFHPFTST
jgi:hypothetical protein